MILFRGQPLPARCSAARGRRGLTAILPDAYISPATGRMAEWLCNGLQIRVQRFDSASGLQLSETLMLRPNSAFQWSSPDPHARDAVCNFCVIGSAVSFPSRFGTVRPIA